jgi:hypothetical protein
LGGGRDVLILRWDTSKGAAAGRLDALLLLLEEHREHIQIRP